MPVTHSLEEVSQVTLVLSSLLNIVHFQQGASSPAPTPMLFFSLIPL